MCNNHVFFFLIKLIYLFVTGESLRCFCEGSKFCPEPIETCRGVDDVCGSVMFSVQSSKWYDHVTGLCCTNNKKQLIESTHTPKILIVSSCFFVFPQDYSTQKVAWVCMNVWPRQLYAAELICAMTKYYEKDQLKKNKIKYCQLRFTLCDLFKTTLPPHYKHGLLLWREKGVT